MDSGPKTCAIMQPYLFPYLGYFHLIHACDTFVFYDDVNYIKKGWINRNRFLNNGETLFFTVPVNNASQNRMIYEVDCSFDSKFLEKTERQISHLYSKAPFFKVINDLLMGVMSSESGTISEMASRSIHSVCSYLDFSKEFKKSSVSFPDTIGMDRADRLIAICKCLECSKYVNLAGGRELYQKEYFSERNIDLYFLESRLPEYKQFRHPFVPGLSIIDVLMFNDKRTVLDFFKDYRLT